MKKNIFIVIFIITTVISAGLAVYFKIDADKTNESLQARVDELTAEVQEKDQEIKTENDKDVNVENQVDDESLKSDVSVTDLFGVDTQSNMIVKIVDNDLYYLLNASGEELITTSSRESQYKKVDSNVKRIKTVNLGSDTTVTFLAIKEDGSAYSLKYNYGTQNVAYEKYMPLSDLKIDDIISIRGFYGEKSGFNAEVKKLDGNTEKIVKYY